MPQTDLPVLPENPYVSRDQKIQGRVSFTDYYYLRKLFPCIHGLTDIIVSTLFRQLCNELRRIDAELLARTGHPIEHGWAVTHPNNGVLKEILERCSFGGHDWAVGRLAADPSRSDVGRGTGELHETLSDPSTVLPGSEGDDREGECQTRGEGTEEGQSGGRDAEPPQPTVGTVTPKDVWTLLQLPPP